MLLRQNTKEQHEAAEQTAVASAMGNGTISPQWWADWMGALLIIHSNVDPYLSPCLRRTLQLCNDIAELNIQPRHCPAATEYASTLTDSVERGGAEYAFTGAHLMGGAIIHKRLNGRLPATHLEWDDRQTAIEIWKPLRDREDLVEAAQRAFSAAMSICKQIEAHDA